MISEECCGRLVKSKNFKNFADVVSDDPAKQTSGKNKRGLALLATLATTTSTLTTRSLVLLQWHVPRPQLTSSLSLLFSAMYSVCQWVYAVFYAPNVVLPLPSSLTGLCWAPCSLPFRQPRRGLPYNCGHSHGVIHTTSHLEIRLACKRQFYPGYIHLHGV